VTPSNDVLVPVPPEERLLCVYGTDLENIGQALLARALRRINALEAEVSALKARP
jgi:hypothetical protein